MKKSYVPLVNHLFREFYKYIIDNTVHITDEIQILREFKHFLDVPTRTRFKNILNIHPVIINEIYPNFGLNSIPSQLYLYKALKQSTTKEVYKTLINLNSNNIFIKNLLVNFIESFPKDTINTRTSRIPTTTLFRQFIYYFQRSLYIVNDTDTEVENKTSLKELKYKKYTSIDDFDFKTFRKQFRFYNMIDKKFPVTQEYKKSYGTYRNCLLDILKQFYIFLYNYIQENNLFHNPFEGSGIDKEILMSSLFNSRFKEGFFYIRDTRLQQMPKRNRIALISTQKSQKARGAKQNIHSFDFTRLFSNRFKGDFMNFIWKSNVSLSRRYNRYLYVLDFLNYKYTWDLKQKK